jgi:CRP-like cAMP-binding protein
MDDIKQLLRHVRLFRGLTTDQIAEVAALGHIEQYEAGQSIIDQDMPGRDLYIVVRGQVEVRVVNGNGSSHAALILGTGQVFGEMALLDQGARSASVLAAQNETAVCSIPGSAFNDLCQRDTGIGYVLMRNLAQDLSFKIRHQNLDH